MSDHSPLPLHSVRVVARRTGLTPDLLRAWEKRYQVVRPVRSAGGQRNYSDADVERLRLLVKATNAGRQIGQVAALSDAELRDLAAADELAQPNPTSIPADDSASNRYLATALNAAESFNANLLESTLRAAVLHLPSDQALDGVIGPLLLEIGARWEQGRFPPANGHLATATIRRVLTWMTDFPDAPSGAPTIVIGTPALQLHDLGAMLAATVAAASGWRVAFLGANLPADELARAAKLAGANTVALSVVHPNDHAHVDAQLRELRNALPQSVALVVGGAGAAAYTDVLAEIGAQRLDSLAALRAWLLVRSQNEHSKSAATD